LKLCDGRRAGRLLVLTSLVFARGVAAESLLSASALAARDEQGFSLERYEAQWARETPSAGQHLWARWHQYALGEEFAGVLPFEGSEAAAQLGGHLMAGYWWFGAAAGFQGQPDRRGATGEAIVARGFPTMRAGTFTPRLEVARGPLAMAALPLSLGIVSDRAQAVLGWRTDGWTGELGARVELWESVTLHGRVRNPALDVIEENRLALGYGYLITQGPGWFDWGLSAKVAWAEHSTLVATQLLPSWRYSWYPASAPPFAWETALVLRAHGDTPSLGASLQVQLPAASRETRQWDGVRQSAWGTAPLEGKLEAHWWFLSATAVQLDGTIFAKPWENWRVWGRGAYRQATLQVSLKQRI
jgi:hypothetical protein